MEKTTSEVKSLTYSTAKCRSCAYLTLPIRGLQKYPRCLFHQNPENCKGPFLPIPDRLDRLGKMLQKVCDEINVEISREVEGGENRG